MKASKKKPTAYLGTSLPGDGNGVFQCLQYHCDNEC